MMSRMIMILSLSLVLSLSLCAETITLQPGPEGKDTYICDCLPDVNNPNGSIYHLYQGQYGSCFDRMLIQWDLSSLPEGIEITSAIMELRFGGLYGSVSGQMAYYRILENWGETDVTFNTQPEYTTDGEIITDFPSSSWHAVDVTDFVIGWYGGNLDNYGLYGHCINTLSTCCAEFISSDYHQVENRPKLTLEYTPASVDFNHGTIPNDFIISQVYPNPFNASTTINYNIPGKAVVEIQIYNILNESVATLIHEEQPPGSHEIEWNAGDLSSGIYLVSIGVQGVRNFQKVVLLK